MEENQTPTTSPETVIKTSIWKYFSKEPGGQAAKCLKCSRILKTTDGATTGLHVHITRIHNIVVKKRNANNSVEVVSTTEEDPRMATSQVKEEPQPPTSPETVIKTSIWKYFSKEPGGQTAKCLKCGRILKTSDGGTTGLHVHISRIHNIVVKKRSVTNSVRVISTTKTEPRMYKFSDINSKCLLCQTNVVDPKLPMSWVYSAWNESCAASMCQLFNLDEDPFENVFVEAGYCSQCHLLIRNIDFTMKSLNCLQQKLNNSREVVEALLRDNYEKITNSENAIKQEPLDPDFPNLASSSWAKSYSSTVKFLFETVEACTVKSTVNPVIVSVSSVGFQKKSKKRKQAVVRQTYPDEETTDYEKLTAGSFRLKRSNTIPSYRYSEVSDTEEPNQDNDSDFMPEVEAILWDENEDLDSADEKNDSDPNSDSDDSDWEMANIPKKKHSRIGSNPTKKPYTEKSKTNRNPAGPKKSRSKKTKYTCSFDEKCTFKATTPIKLQAHVNAFHNGDTRPFHCEACKGASNEKKQYAFGSITGYNYHQKKYHPTSESTIVCNICKKSFFERWELKRHTAMTHCEINLMLRCFHCKKMFDADKPDELAQHEQLHNSKLKPFACVLCDKQDYTNSYDLSAHVTQEHEEMLVKCELCKKAFKSKRKLKDHVIASHTERNAALQCTQCPYRALWPSALARHVERHTTQRNFQCDKCPNRYKTQHCLNYHLRVTHGKNRKFKCTVCDKMFGSSCLKKAHEETHNTVKSYYCELCGKAFMSKKYLGQHMRGHKGTLKKYPQSKAARARQPKAGPARNIPADVVSNTTTSADFEDEMEVEIPVLPRSAHRSPRFIDDTPGSSNLQFRELIRLPNEHTAGSSGPTANAMSNWNNSEQHPYHRLANHSVYQEQQNPSTLDLSQGAQFLSILQQQHAIANNYYSSME